MSATDELCQENEQLRQELAIRESSEQEKVIDYLGKECADWEVQYLALAGENAKLRELVRDMYGFIRRTDEDCGDVTFSDCFDYCKHDTADDGCCKTGECWYEQRMRELGVEVEA